jgi:hypothetical protein
VESCHLGKQEGDGEDNIKTFGRKCVLGMGIWIQVKWLQIVPNGSLLMVTLSASVTMELASFGCFTCDEL